MCLFKAAIFCQMPKWNITVSQSPIIRFELSRPLLINSLQNPKVLFDGSSMVGTVLLIGYKSQRRFYSQCPTIQFQGRALLLNTQKGDVLFTIAGHYIMQGIRGLATRNAGRLPLNLQSFYRLCSFRCFCLYLQTSVHQQIPISFNATKASQLGIA